MGRCSHVAALLFALEDYIIQFGHEPPSCTSKLCGWNIGRKQKDPQPAHTQRYYKKSAPDRIIVYDPCPSTDVTDVEFATNFIKQLPLVANRSMFDTILEIEYEDYTLSDERRHELLTLTSNFIANIKEAAGCEPHAISGTTGQGSSALWHSTRLWYITASNCKSFACTKSDQAWHSLLNRVYGGSSLKTPAMKYGTDHEDDAFSQYRQCDYAKGHTVTKSGFWVNPQYPGFGCSPDGLVYIGEDLVGIVEIKCPMTLAKTSPLEAENVLTKSQLQSFCCKVEQGQLWLKENHDYYYQVQMQMAICNVLWCDFVVWSSAGMSVQRVHKNTSFWTKVSEKISHSYQTIVVPDFFEMRTPRKLLPFRLSDN